MFKNIFKSKACSRLERYEMKYRIYLNISA